MRFYSIASILIVIFFFLYSIPTTTSKILNEIEDSNKFFVFEIFNKYGSNDSITFEGFEHLLENLGLGKLKFDTKHDVSIHKINGTFKEFHDELLLHKHNHNSSTTESTEDDNKREKRDLNERQIRFNKDVEKTLKRKCLTAQDILITFGLHPNHDTVISPLKYLQMCPAIVYELDQKLCQQTEISEAFKKQSEYHLVWIYATVSIFIMGASGILCALLLPAMKKNQYCSFQQFLVSLGVGTLCGDALVHLLPPVFSATENHSSDLAQILRGTIILAAIFIFFIIENILNGIRTLSQEIKNIGPTLELDSMLSKDDRDTYKSQHRHQHSSGGVCGQTPNDSIKTIAWIAIMGDILHNVTDGLSIGAAFTSNLSSGFASSIAIFCHELPHELGDYAILLASGMSVKKSLFYNFVSSVFSFFGMAAGILLGEIKNGALWINAFTAGSFLYIALSDLVPELKIMVARSNYKNLITQIVGLLCGGFLMLAIALYEDDIENMLR